ncbi:hypothetical protein SAMN05421829_1142 [Aromatoleum tolulyticum]|uniref:Uncharacterized protein n=1 Tax=Aromatoleum tolulyticum TaxID=34027 RepID=A0A1N7ADK3_9RHOO|nr:hypothetical protein SAMN05421829_1142 [Aromatoleum tolulyticum]
MLGLCIRGGMNLNLFLQVVSGCEVIISSLNVFRFVENLRAEMSLILGVVQ